MATPGIMSSIGLAVGGCMVKDIPPDLLARVLRLRRLRLALEATEAVVIEVARDLHDQGVPAELIAEALGISAATWYRRHNNPED